MIDYEQVKNLVFMEEAQQHDVFHSVMRQMSNVSEHHFLNYMQAFSIYCLKFVSGEEMKIVTEHLVTYILQKGIYVNQIVEFCGFYIKFFDATCQRKIFHAVMYISGDLIQTPKGLAAVAKFIRETSKVLSVKQIKQCTDLLEKAYKSVPLYLADTIAYTIENIRKIFRPTKSDVLLVIPEFLSGTSFLQPPICMMQVKSDLLLKGFTVDLFDNRVYHYSIDQLVDIIGDNYQYIVVTSSPIDQYQAYFVDKRFVVFAKTVNAIQSSCKYDKLIVCGSHGTVDYKLILNDIAPDIIFCGNYEHRLGRVIAELKSKTELSNIPGIVFRKSGRYVKSCVVDSDTELAVENSYIDYSLIDLNDYYGYRYVDNNHVLKRKWAILQNTTGCPYNCIFCYNIYGKKVKYKNITNVIRELKQLESQGCQEVFFIDQTFTISRAYTEELCKSIIENNITINWQCETRVDLLTENTLELMKKAGCSSIWLGIESFDDDVLVKNQKNYSKAQLIKLLDILRDKDISYSAFIMFGMYGETVKSLNFTADTLIKNKVKTSKSFIQCIPRPGTQLYMKLSDSIRKRVTHFWQIESLRNEFLDGLTQKDIDAVRERLISSR